jgi:hypothetical protein
MKKQRTLELLTLGVTSLLLVAHGGGGLPCEVNDADSADFDVVGECGPAGRIKVSLKEGSCGIVTEGDDVGLPTTGSGDSIRRGGWSLDGPIPAADGQHARCSVYGQGSSEETHRFEVSCYEGNTLVCQSFLIEPGEKCDVASCAAVECETGYRLALADGGCCPTCVECPECLPYQPKPPPEPEPCDPTVCRESCDPGFELIDIGECCPLCSAVEDPELCEAGRTEFYAALEQEKSQWLSCTHDAECFVFSPVSRCGSMCGLLASGPAYSAPYEALQNDSQELCLHCPAPEYTCGNEPSPAARCVDGVCQLAP